MWPRLRTEVRAEEGGGGIEVSGEGGRGACLGKGGGASVGMPQGKAYEDASLDPILTGLRFWRSREGGRAGQGRAPMR
jgi:hypothetical protein